MKLQTTRLLIRPTTLDDLDAIHTILSDQETMTFFVEGTYTKESIKAFITNNAKETIHYSVLLKDSNTLIGKLSYNDWFMTRTKEIGWIFNKGYTKKGYCTEAAEAVVNYAFTEDKIHRLIATCQPENTSSKRVCEKLNMRLEGHFKQCIHVKDNVWWDELFYSILEEEFDDNSNEETS